MYHVRLEKCAGHNCNIHVASFHRLDDAGCHKALLHDSGGARILLHNVVPLYYSVASAWGFYGPIPFLPLEHQVGHTGSTILSAVLLQFIYLQGVHNEYLADLLIYGSDAVLTGAPQTLLHVELSHYKLRNWEELLVHAVLEQ